MQIENDMEVLNEVEKIVTSNKFAQFLLSNTTSFNAAAYILQKLLDAVEADKEEFREED